MKQSLALAAVIGALDALAGPTPTEVQPPTKRASLPQVSVSGNAFWANGERFYIRGIDYQPGGASGTTDPLGDPETCSRDVAEFKKLGLNTVRVYAVDNSASHDDCMAALAGAGIYLLLDLNTPKYSINRANAAQSYNAAYLQSIFATVDAFAKYDNTLLFFSGNEVINDEPDTTKAAPYVKAVTRDVRAYMKKRGLRQVPVGYSAADVSQNREQTAQYMNCGADDVRSDFFAFNDYSWCNTDFLTSGWDQKVKNFTDYGLPIFLSEYGCIKNGRNFGEVAALMSPNMTSVYSGGLLYEYSLEDNGFGIVTINGGSVKEQPEFGKFASALNDNPAPTGSGGAASTTHPAACPTMDSVWEVDPSTVPAMPSEALAYFDSGAGAGPGLQGGGSQDAVDSGTSKSNMTTETGQKTSTGGGGGGGGDDNAGAGPNAPNLGSLVVVGGTVMLMLGVTLAL